ncbi:MAG: VWA domain-containing protein [Chloroflexi bacterium]|nr:VWA domain-containing protein [Chloroflexota bacterium]
MTFSTPLALALLLVIPFVLYVGWPRQRFRRRRDITSLLLRVVIILLLVLSLAGTQVAQSADRLAVVFLVDVSDSVGQSARESQLQYIRDALAAMGPDDLAGVVAFGANALVERPLSSVRELTAFQSAPTTNNTDLAEAIRLGLALFPNDVARRLVILSDGLPTVGDTQAAAELAAASGVEISTVTFTPQADQPEVQVTDVRVPSAVNAGQQFDLSLSIQSEADTPASITVLQSGAIIHQETVQLRRGANNYTLPLQGTGAGFRDFQVQVEPQANDNFYQNNRLSSFTRVIGPPRLLLLYNTPDDIRHLQPALEQAGLSVDTMTPEQLPVGLVPLAQYDSVILANVPATRLSPQRMQALQTYVRDLGGGLVAVGGPNAYGPGGYFQTPLEETLPLDMQVRDQQRLPQLTIAYVIDRSGSMGTPNAEGIPNIELAKEAIIRSIDFLQPTDRAGIVSFDTSGYWIAELQDVRDRLALQRLVASLRSGGGTDILAGMNLVASTIVNDPSDRKHIILLTDGGANPSGLIELSERLNRESGVTTSVIAIGSGAAGFLEQMAQAGGGNYHAVTQVDQIPTIFTIETVLATRSYIIEEPFVPVLTASSPIMDGITASPELLGYVATSPKLTSQIILRGQPPYSDPILAAWQYGLGRSVAFTSDATARWGANWVTWDNFVRFWSQTVRWTITESAESNLETRVVLEGEQARLIVDARDMDGDFLNGADLQLSLVNPQARATQLPLRQVAPGRYEATFNPTDEGAYILHVQGTGTAGDRPVTFDQTTGWVMSYSSEYDVRAGRTDGAVLLNELAALTGGRSLTDDPAAAFAHNLVAQRAFTPIWPWLLLAALLLLPFDVAVRRLIITRTDLQRARAFLFRARQVEKPVTERLSTLMEAKERGRQRTAEIGAASTVGALRTSREQRRADGPVTTAVETPVAPRGDATPPAPKVVPEGNLAGQLLKKRKDREEK